MQTQFERFPFSLTRGNLASDGPLVGDKTFTPTKRIERIIEQEAEELPPPPPTFSEEELAEAKEEAYRKGFNDGENKGKAWADSEIAKTEQAALELTPTIIEHATSLFARYDQFVEDQKEASTILSLAIAKKMTAELPAEQFFEQVAAHAVQCVEQMLGEPEIHIHVHPTLSDRMEERLASHFAGAHEPGDVIIHSDDGLDVRDCRVEWASGGMEYKHGAVQARLEEIISALSPNISVQTESAAPLEPVANEAIPSAGGEAAPILDDAQAGSDAPLSEAQSDDKSAEPAINATEGEPEPVTEAVADAIANQLADDDIPPIPELPEDGGDTTPTSEPIETKNPTEGESNE